MSEPIAVAGAVIAWLGGTLLIVSDGRRGLTAGLLVITAGLALASAAGGRQPPGVAALAIGGASAATLRLRSGRPGWGILPEGSTPRLVGAIVVLIGAALVAGSGLGSPPGPGRLAAIAVAGLAAGQVLTGGRRAAALGGASALALALGALGDTTALFAGAAVAAALGALDGVDPVEVGG